MRKLYVIIYLFTCVWIMNIQAQVKYDYNWTFGNNAGINFDSFLQPNVFTPNCFNQEMSGAISNSQGGLLIYFDTYKDANNYAYAKGKNNNIIYGSDSLFMFSSSTSGPISIVSDNKILVFHLGDDNEPPLYQTCNSYACPRLYYSVFRIIDFDSVVLEKKNNRLLDEILYERIAAVKHANGKDWWLLAHAQIDSSIFNRRNRFYKFVIQDGDIIPYQYQDIGMTSSAVGDLLGQMKFSNKGNKLGIARYESRYYEVYNFNRCNGSLEVDKGGYLDNSRELYGLEFSSNEKYIYLTSKWVNGFITKRALFQIDISTNSTSQLIIDTTDKYYGQLQIAPNSKIFSANNKNGAVSNIFILDTFNTYLSVINQPDSMGLACDFQPFSFYLGDSSCSSIGLPNFPNYRLGALSIYEADAGRDTVLCIDSTVNQKVVVLGTAPINGVQYQWYPNYNLSSDTVAQPLAYPDSSTMYYLMLSDTTITNACKTRLDSVYVEVKKCISSVNGQLSTVYSVKVFPNPASSEIKIVSERHKIAHIAIHDIAGKIIPLQLPLGKGERGAVVDINHLPQGIYFIETQLSNGQTTINKLVKQ